jgi:adenylate kinase family enzyme
MIDLAHVRWIGGSPCSGKSSIAALLAERYDCRRYTCDDHWTTHTERAEAVSHPRLYRIGRMTWDEIWMRPVDELLRDNLAILREEWPMILHDLLALPRDRPIIAEGAALLPELVAPLLTHLHRAVWIVPTPAFQREQYGKRPWITAVLSQCRDPDRAWRNWMDRDESLARYVAAEATMRELPLLTVDGTQSIEAHAQDVAGMLGLARR